MNDTVNRMNALSGAFTAPLIDGVYSICQDTTVLLDIHVLIRTLWEKQQYEEAMRLLSILSRLIPETVFSPSEQIAGKDESSIFLEQFLADCVEILAEYATYPRGPLFRGPGPPGLSPEGRPPPRPQATKGRTDPAGLRVDEKAGTYERTDKSPPRRESGGAGCLRQYEIQPSRSIAWPLPSVPWAVCRSTVYQAAVEL